MNKKIAVIGGDLRQIKMSKYMMKDSYSVMIYGFSGDKLIEENVEIANDLESAVSDADMVVLGIPSSLDNLTICTALFDETIYISDLFKYMPKGCILTGGIICNKIQEEAEKNKILCVDYMEREELTILNAIPTAEGAIQLAMEETPITIHGSNVLIVGFGRIGKILAKMINGIGANVTCSARRHEDIAWIDSYGYKSVFTKDISTIINDFNIIFNTVPHIVITEIELLNMKEDALIIDLASKPGGIDFEKAKDRCVKVIWALSIPGKVAPSTAGNIIKCTVINILNESNK